MAKKRHNKSARDRRQALATADAALFSGHQVDASEKRFEGREVNVVYNRFEQRKEIHVTCSALDFYKGRKMIDGRMAAAGERFARDYARSGMEARAIVLQERVQASPKYEMSESQLAAADSFRKAIRYVTAKAGPLRTDLIMAVCIEDLRAIDFMNERRPQADPRYSNESLKEALETLADFYGM